MDNPTAKSFRFGEFCLDTEEKLLWRDGKSVSLPPKVLDVLCLLAQKEGRIVSKSEIMDTVWADSFVEESNLTQSIYTLRRTLGADAGGQSIVETVPRRGFRIAVPIFADPLVEKLPVVPELSKPAPAGFFGKHKLALGILGVVLAAGLITFFAYLYYFPAKPAMAPVENVSFQKLTFTGNTSSPTISPDGKSIAFVKQGDLYLQDINTGSHIRLDVVDQKIFSNLQFSPDGESLYFRNERRTDAGGDMFQVSRFGGAARKAVENSWSGIGFSPDGKNISFVRYFPKQAQWTLFTKNLETGEEKPLFERNSPESIYRTGFPAWSPDGKKIVTVAQQKPASTVYVIDTETGQAEKQHTPRFVQIEQTVWSARGDGIILVGREKDRFFQLWRMNWPGGEIQRITNDLSTYRHISISADGKNLIAENQTTFSHIWTAGADNLDEQKQLTSGNSNRDGALGVTWTPDGNLVYSSRVTGEADLWSLRLADNLARQFTRNAGQNNDNPIVSPDGRFIYFESNRTNSHHVWRIDADGNNPTQITFSDKENEYYPALSPDGQWLYFLKKSPRGNVILRQNLTDKKIETVTEQGAFSPNTFIAPSPDGKLLAFNNIKETRDDDGNSKTSEIGVVYLEEQNKVKIFNFPRIGGSFDWTPDSRAFDYYENTLEGAKLWRRTLDETAEPKLLLTIPKTTIFNFAWSADGKNLALARGIQERDILLLKNFE